ncbi:MAG: anthranilate synthase component I family protein, partial [Bacteroidetes bacterium]
MRTYSLHTRWKKLLADTVTPVSLYLRLRDHFACPLLLESSDYHGHDNTYSFIGLEPLAAFSLSGNELSLRLPDGSKETSLLTKPGELPGALEAFMKRFETDAETFRFPCNGLFGYQSYDVVRQYETVDIQTYPDAQREIPDLLYYVYRYLIVINHFNNEMYLFEHSYGEQESRLGHIESLIYSQTLPQYGFEVVGKEETNYSDETFLDILQKGKDHCQRGDVFQIVLSRQFRQAFRGDEFQVYRMLRSINPSPYLFYCDYGSFKLMGSSPEAQLIIGK